MKPLRILLVDDDALIGELLTELLEDMGHVVCGIETTEAGAVQAGLAGKPDLMIVDAQLREGSGVAAVEAIARVASVPHILMSGAPIPAGRRPALLLQKPFMYDDLVSAIERATGVERR
jgi:DNA-binding NtrC family response regulator